MRKVESKRGRARRAFSHSFKLLVCVCARVCVTEGESVARYELVDLLLFLKKSENVVQIWQKCIR